MGEHLPAGGRPHAAARVQAPCLLQQAQQGSTSACLALPGNSPPSTCLLSAGCSIFVWYPHALLRQIINTVQAMARGSGLAVPPPDQLPAGPLGQYSEYIALMEVRRWVCVHSGRWKRGAFY